MASSIPSLNTASQTAVAEPAAAQTAPAGLVAGTQTFLKLLVAQIQNQNPLSPADGVQFLTQLAQFSELEQVAAIRQDLHSLLASAAASGAAKPSGA